ncbi:hypothetical protein COR50_01480 [Chitinophaga caeni]|uniref:Uncharacterized protein n=1 Tax=Chitinophaga caeni TaxID=2029983 RepID=A0A291QPS2_9BACT|nr:YqgE/AlgH family protein [Chitinophaga caeni]ATL45936.1 hypothetical protein COR50_01480 [Chitinophaga caeni]
MASISPGKLLIADPFLKDPHFHRSIVLLCDHEEDEGSYGLILNKPLEGNLQQLLPDVSNDQFPIYYGGPVQVNSLQFIHRSPGLLEGSVELQNGLFLGGDFDQLMEKLKLNTVDPGLIKFFIGYSGWGEGQLAGELKEHSWILSNAIDIPLVFDKEEQEAWKQALRDTDNPDIAIMANYPIDPQLN